MRGEAPDDRRSRRRWPPALVAALLSVTVVAAAQAQVDPAQVDPTQVDPTQADQNLDTPGSVADTEYTPAAEDDTTFWDHVGGAAFGQTEKISGSPTDFDVDLYAVSFRNQDRGFAGGAVCAQPVAREPDETDEAYGIRVKGCERVPVIYRFTDTAIDGPVWEEVYRGDDPGYVGAIAWIDAKRAVAVGGDGHYPRREEGFRTTDPAETYETWAARDPAGNGRAWLYDVGSTGDRWSELSAEDGELPQEIRGMTALAFHPGTGEFGAAGALGQILEWEEGGFTDLIDSSSPSEVIEDGPLFRYRVRDLTFISQETPQAFGVTAGCCGQTPVHPHPVVLAYGGNAGRWSAKPAGWHNIPVPFAGTPTGAAPVNPGQELPDSFYSVIASHGPDATRFRASYLASPGGPERPGERVSVNSVPQCVNSMAGSTLPTQLVLSAEDPAFAALRHSISSSRLVDGDGDAGEQFAIQGRSDQERERGEWRASPNTLSGADMYCGNNPNQFHGDGVPDWEVGELRSTARPGLGARALAVATHFDPSLTPDTIDINGEKHDTTALPDPSVLLGGYQPTSAEKLIAYTESAYFLLPTYSLNAIDVVGDTGSGWAVGDRGGIVELSEEGLGLDREHSGEPEPPTLGPRRPATTNQGPYGELGPDADAGPPGPVPALAGRREQRLPEPRMFAAGSADPTRRWGDLVEDVAAMVISRDGQEGWALGPTRAANPASARTSSPTVYRFDGASWSRCDPVGIAGIIPPDPACEALAELREYRESSGASVQRRAVRLLAATRVPLENDDDPSNDDEFEVVATGTDYAPTPTGERAPVILRFRDGRWGYEDAEARGEITSAGNSGLNQLAFASPGSGWALRTDLSGVADRLYHYDGTSWHDCGATAAECDGAEGRGSFAPAAAGSDGNVVRGLVSAGDRVYLYGYRVRNNEEYPMVLYRDLGDVGWRAASGGLDPGYDQAGDPEALRGRVESLSVDPSKRHGWAVGSFSAGPAGTATRLLRLGDGGWEPHPDRGPLGEYLTPETQNQVSGTVTAAQKPTVAAQLTTGEGRAFIAQGQDGRGAFGYVAGRIFGLAPDAESWELLELERPRSFDSPIDGAVQAMASDGDGGFWAAVRNDNRTGHWDSQNSHVWFFHYTDRPPEPVFSEAPNPIEGDRRVTALGASPDGAVWLGTDSDTLYRYERAAGWEPIRVPGWDPGRVVTRSSAVKAIAIGPGGEGLAVGEGGRIAQLSPTGAVLDRAAGTACRSTGGAAPCGTGLELAAAAVAPDGSAMVGGERMTLLWRPPGGEFGSVAAPKAATTAGITGIAMPQPGWAMLTTDNGLLFEGHGSGQGWSWELDNVDEDGELLSVDGSGTPIPLRAIALDQNGHGYAVGDRGLVLERSGEDGLPWRRLHSAFLDDLTSVTVPPHGGGALIGGRNDLILTASGGRLEVAQHADYLTFPESHELTVPSRTKRIVGLALLPGLAPGQTEAWAASDAFASSSRTSRLLHYASDPGEPLLEPAGRAAPLPDVPPARENELSFAAFGKSDCAGGDCVMQGSSDPFEVTARAIADEISRRSDEPGGPRFAVFTGDAADRAADSGSAGSESLRRWSELVADRLGEAGVPTLGAIGVQDLSLARACVGTSCYAQARAGDNLAWRAEMAGRPRPWGGGDPAQTEGMRLEPAPDPGGGQALSTTGGGARTHYAVDAYGGGDDPLARLVFADTALGSLSAGEPLQEPVEPGGQATWLERMLCARGSGDANCTRDPAQPAIVVTNTPTYSYGPGALTDTQTDATLFETILMRNGVSAVVSGRLGWNALYWATAPGVHQPCPGGDYPTATPEPGSRDCEGVADQGPAGDPLANDLVAGGATGLLPFVVASSAGERFGPEGEDQGDAAAGFWHGYTLVRVSGEEDGSSRVLVEQRPVFDWLRLSAGQHLLRAGKTLRLKGEGREAMGPTLPSEHVVAARFDDIASPAITHRYELVQADPDRPWLPKPDQGSDDDASELASTFSDEIGESDPCGPYLCLDPKVGTLDSQSGEIKAGNGNYPRTYAIAVLSAGDKSASYPLVFEPRASFRVKPAAPAPPVAVPAPPPPPAPAQPTAPSVNLPAAPVLPVLTAQALAPPPVPPAPPTFASEAPLDLNLSPAALDVTPPTAVSQPPTPPVNPAPPGGARKEARQRQAAAQKSGADSAEDGSDAAEQDVDLARGPSQPEGAAATRLGSNGRGQTSAATRRARAQPQPSITAMPRPGQPSAWTRDLLLGGGLGIAALLLALGVNTARPTPRRRQPELPAPAYSRAHARVRRIRP